MLNNFLVEEHVKKALMEDIGFQDISTEALMEDKIVTAYLKTRVDGVFCGEQLVRIKGRRYNSDNNSPNEMYFNGRENGIKLHSIYVRNSNRNSKIYKSDEQSKSKINRYEKDDTKF
jgi:hypothetical protein